MQEDDFTERERENSELLLTYGQCIRSCFAIVQEDDFTERAYFIV